jgi:subtilase family serine protease
MLTSSEDEMNSSIRFKTTPRAAAMIVLIAAVVPLLSGCFGGGGSKERKAALTSTNANAPGPKPHDIGGSPAGPDAKASHPKGLGRQAKLHQRKVCPGLGKGHEIVCTSKVATDKNGTPLTFPKPDAYTLQGINGTVWGFGPKDYHANYNLPWNASVQQTIGIVLWNDDPTAKKDLDAFNSAFSLGSFPSCSSLTTWAACFAKVNQRGGSTMPSVADRVGLLEAALDVEYAHAMCLNCRIILVEADSNSNADLAAAENMAYRLGATEINNSWGAEEGDATCASMTSTYASAFNHPGVAIVASSGDDGWAAQCPADLNTVVGVGGTDLFQNSDFSYWYETVFDEEDFFGNVTGPGSGCSALTSARSFQTATANWSRTGCGTKRGITDVSASFGGAWVYNSSAGYNNDPLNAEATGNYWYVMYGTSLAAPIISATYGLAGNGWTVSYPAQFAYQHPGSFHDISSGSNGYCGTIMCQASQGYDGPTGMGSPSGLGGF